MSDNRLHWYDGHMKPLIGITVGEIQNAMYPWGPIVYGQSYGYCEAIERAGGVPCLIPLMSDATNLEQLYKRLDGILCAGGNDLDPALYGEAPQPATVNISKRRDTAEVQLIKWALRDKKPILGICRGMQLLNVVRGGTLYQDIQTQIENAADHTVSTVRRDFENPAHSIKIDQSSRLAGILKKQTIRTNSHHHQAVKDMGKNLQAVAWADDGVVEAIESLDDTYAIGVQCHPESLEAKTVPELRRLFLSFVTAAKPA